MAEIEFVLYLRCRIEDAAKRLQRTRRERRGCDRGIPWAGSLVR